MKELTDTDSMPFGKHKGEPMQDVPARYFHWLWTEAGLSDENNPVANYIRNNLTSLEQEYPDGIWKSKSEGKENAKAEDQEFSDHLKLVVKVGRLCKEASPDGGAGEIDCPCGKGKVGYRVASCNKHCWAKCSCGDVAFME